MQLHFSGAGRGAYDFNMTRARVRYVSGRGLCAAGTHGNRFLSAKSNVHTILIRYSRARGFRSAFRARFRPAGRQIGARARRWRKVSLICVRPLDDLERRRENDSPRGSCDLYPA